MKRLELGGIWILSRLADGSQRPMSVPGDILSALIASGEVADPYVADNELSLQWVGREDWSLTRSFELDAEFLSCRHRFIEFECLDTIAEVRINGELIGTSANMFRRLRADPGNALHPGSNVISITIRSPERAAEELASRCPYPIPASRYPVSSPHRNLVRKAQCMGGWDWGPCLMTGGIYDGAAIIAHDGPRIEYIRTSMSKAPSEDGLPGYDFLVEVTLELSSVIAQEAAVLIALAGVESRTMVTVPEGSSLVHNILRIHDPKLWWPAGYGDQNLYDLHARVSAVPSSAVPSSAAPSVDATSEESYYEASVRIGFRDLRVETLEDEFGKSMTIAVNGTKIFAKGANWIPADALPSRWTRKRLAALLESAVYANMNCLRVWGGGRYESDAFYELCDKYGLLVWQDCMFSCALYPSTPEFLSEVEEEIRHQVKRLAFHPSIALWCGNNEALGAISWYDESKNSPARYIADYDRLTEGTIGRVVRELDPGRTWWPSSPSAGPDDYSDNWHEDGRGDMHFWSVWHEAKPFSEYLTVQPRFCSEFGFQSFPSYRTITSFAPPSERNVSSPIMEHHQRNPRGNTIIIETMLRYFRMPKGFKETLYLSQVQQALAIKTAVEYWRSSRPRCMGTLYWQLNDVWPGASWSSLEYDGSWKILHHEARRFYEPLLLTLFIQGTYAFAYVVNDGPNTLELELDLHLSRFDGSKSTSIGHIHSSAEPESSTLLWKASLAELTEQPTELFIEATLKASSKAATDPEPAYRRAQLFLTEPKRCTLSDARLSLEVVSESGRLGKKPGLAIDVSASAPAFYITPSADDIPGRFDDAGFYLASGEHRIVRFMPAPDTPRLSAEELKEALRIDDLRSSYE